MVPSWVLFDFYTKLVKLEFASFNMSVSEGFVSSVRKEADVIPVAKRPLLSSIKSDLRPISLIATLRKILDSFVGGQILEIV